MADELAIELIDRLSGSKKLKVIDVRAMLRMKGSPLGLHELADEYRSHYIATGAVRKVGEQIKVSASLIEHATRVVIWQDSFAGNESNLFELQETVAQNLAVALNITIIDLQRVEQAKKGTTSSKAYAYWLQARNLTAGHPLSRILQRIPLFRAALIEDPRYLRAMGDLGNDLITLHDLQPSPAHLDEAAQVIDRIEAAAGKLPMWNLLASRLALGAGDVARALNLIESTLELDPS